MEIQLTEEQEQIKCLPTDHKIFLRGPAGSGKTTAGVARLRHLIEEGIPAHSIMVLVPQKRLALPYYSEIRNPQLKVGAEVTVTTLGSLSRQIVRLFWPLAVEQLSRTTPYKKPVFLTLEMVQYLMFKLLDPEIELNDYFNSVIISRPRLFSQIADNLNKSSIVGFDFRTIGERLKTALPGDQERLHIFDDAQACANIFRQYCVENNLLDFSLQVSLFIKHLWEMEAPRAYLAGRYRHIIADNIEEDTPATHQLLDELMQECKSALLIYDTEAGYRRFLGADEENALSLSELCDSHFEFTETKVMTSPVQALLAELRKTMKDEEDTGEEEIIHPEARIAIEHTSSNQSRYHTQMLDWVADKASQLVNENGIDQNRIVILAPILHDSLRFSLTTRLEQKGLTTYSLRPSRPLHSEPATRALMTLAKLSHPQWEFEQKYQVNRFDIIQTLIASISELDLARATLLTDVLFRKGVFVPFSTVTNPEMRSRITEVFGERYQYLFDWIDEYKTRDPEPIDIFLSRLFGEALSQKGFGFHADFDSARIVTNLIDSSRHFRQAVFQLGDEIDVGNQYVKMVDSGILADQYEPREWMKRPDAVLVSPAYTFLLSNQAVDYQFWVNIDSPAWSRRLQQPLTQPYVLSRQWNEGDIWTDAHETSTSREMLFRVITGLVKRCRRKIFIGYSRFDERGNDKAGDLRNIFDYILRSLPTETDFEEENGR